MRIFLLPTRRDRCVCYFEEAAPKDDQDTRRTEPTGRLERIKAQVVEGYRRLEKKRPLAERIGSKLRKEDRLDVIYPKDMTEAEARNVLYNFLTNQIKHERTWKNRDAVLACLGAPLFFLPGPNVWFYYPAIRVLGHYYAESGCKRFLSSFDSPHQRRRIRFQPSAELAELKRMLQGRGGKRLDKSKLEEIGQRLGLTGLLSLYEQRKI